MDIVQLAWEKYVAKPGDIPDHIDGLSDEIVESWKRCKQILDPFQKQLSFLSQDVLEKKIEENALLIKIAYPYLLKFYHHLQSDEYQIILTDSEGCQLKRIANTKQQDILANENQLFDGCLYSEEKAGTNGIGLCLKLNQPVMIVGYEHYLEIYHHVVCYCTPIYDHLEQLIGCILITGATASFNPMIMGMLSAASSGIQKEFELTTINHLLYSTMESFNSAIVIIDHQKRIIHYNKNVFKFLQLNQENLFHKSIYDIIDYHSLPSSIRLFDTELTNVECPIFNIDMIHIDVSLTVKVQNMNTTLIIIDLQDHVHKLVNQITGTKAHYTFDDIKGNSKAIENVKLMGLAIAQSDNSALISGEMGTGKDVLAQAIHNASRFKNGPFITVDCSIVQKAYLETELWGNGKDCHLTEKKPGKIELAECGTLFLIEISNMSMEVQEKLYQFIKTKEFINPLTHYRKTMNIRILASTNKNLYSLVEEGMFRQDLYYALNTLHLIVPPLREHNEDIVVLSQYYMQQYGQSIGLKDLTLNEECLHALLHYRWPGNVRQLESVIDCAVNAVNGKEIGLNALPLDIINDYYADKNSLYFYASNRLEPSASSLHPKAQEYNQILYAIKVSNGNVKQAAASLHMSLSTIYRKIKKYHIYPKDFEK